MDIGSATRSTATLVLAGMPQSIAAPAVSGNDESPDPLVSRAAGEAEAAAKVGDGDNTELRGKDSSPGQEYSQDELTQLQDLRARDREVRAHEMAHLAAAGRHSRGGPSFTFESGPDGRRYAVAGEVSIDTSAESGDPAATLAKAQQVRRAALAPATPSAQDRQIAAQAAAMAAQATAELAQQRNQVETEPVTPVVRDSVEQTYGTPVGADASLIELVA